MNENVRTGHETTFVLEWLKYLVINNVVLNWSQPIKNAVLVRTLSLIADNIKSGFRPYMWFERFDDQVMRDSLDETMAEDFGDLDDMEVGDWLTNPFEGL